MAVLEYCAHEGVMVVLEYCAWGNYGYTGIPCMRTFNSLYCWGKHTCSLPQGDSKTPLSEHAAQTSPTFRQSLHSLTPKLTGCLGGDPGLTRLPVEVGAAKSLYQRCHEQKYVYIYIPMHSQNDRVSQFGSSYSKSVYVCPKIPRLCVESPIYIAACRSVYPANSQVLMKLWRAYFSKKLRQL